MQIVTLRALLDLSVQEEQNAQDLYRSAALQVKDAAAQRFLATLIAEESRHEQELRAIASRVNAEKLTLAIEDARELELVDAGNATDPAFEDTGSIHGLLLLALKREKRASAVYARMAEAAEDPVARAVLTSLATAEDDHARRIKAYFQLVR